MLGSFNVSSYHEPVPCDGALHVVGEMPRLLPMAAKLDHAGLPHVLQNFVMNTNPTVGNLAFTILMLEPARQTGLARNEMETDDEELPKAAFFDNIPVVKALFQEAFGRTPSAGPYHKVLEALEDSYSNSIDTAVAKCAAKANAEFEKIRGLFGEDCVKYIKDKAEEEITDPEKSADLLNNARGEACTLLYNSFKVVNEILMFEPTFNIEGMATKTETRSEANAALASFRELFATVKMIVASNTVITSLFRDLKKDEKRNDLAARTNRVLLAKKLRDSLPPPLVMILDRTIGR